MHSASMLSRHGHTTHFGCMIAMLLSPAMAETARAGDRALGGASVWDMCVEQCSPQSNEGMWRTGGWEDEIYGAETPSANVELMSWFEEKDASLEQPQVEDLPPGEAWSTLSGDERDVVDAAVETIEPWMDESVPVSSGAPADWGWRVLPAGLIYRSYMAGVHEPRISIVAFHERESSKTLWDATLGGRGGVLRFGNGDPLRPQGWQLDVEGAVMVRLDVENRQDLESSDYRFGFPITYGIANWQFKFGYYHISSHLGDERMLREPDQDERLNYVRDGIIYGISYYPLPSIRLYGEVGGAFNSDGGAEPFETQFGTELSPPGPTGGRGAPFLAVNGHLRQDHHFGGDVSVQTGWLWRGEFGQMMRLGFHYFNGKSSQFQFFNQFEQQVGVGLWYDF